MSFSQRMLRSLIRHLGEQVIVSQSAEVSCHGCGKSDQGICEIPHRGHDQIRLMRRHAKGTPTPIDEGRSHSRRFSTDAIEGVIGDEEHPVHTDPHDLRRFEKVATCGLKALATATEITRSKGIPW